ncbi:hypothetical protein [Bdellovibrio reynosensis]|uniref:Uncharacterized protein n=1 Tax=Bdellovibrio reynosensis TaxID=2835041 RepID=A0ABY4C5D1_9BACT|nr:hypothetical protein [Bdellovibrio reynosensis]UOF00170.1 hypothetical protein MNR06_10700 [Bdellovibrio reynosensis]
MAFPSRILFISIVCFFCLAAHAQELNKAIVKVVPFSSLQKGLHPFQTDCRNILREPQVQWDQIEIVSFKAQSALQLKISGEVLENLDVRFWSRRILLYDKNKKPLKPVILPAISLPLKNETGYFLISVNVPEEANMISVPLEFYGADRFRYLIHVRNVHQEMTAEAYPNLDKVGRDFCTRDLMWAGVGLMGAVQKQDTSPVETTLDLSSFTFDNLSFEKRWNWKVDRSIRVFAHSGTFQFNNFLDVAGAERVIDINTDVTFTRRHWNYKNSLFKVQYGYLGSANFERRPYAVILSSTEGSISVGQHLSVAAGGYAELFSHNNKWYTEATLRFHPLHLGLDHTYSGIGFSGSLGIARPFGYEKALGIYSYGTMFQGKHSGSDTKDNSDVFYFQTHLEIRYGWLF